MRPGSTVADAKKAAPREGNMLQFKQFPEQGMPAVGACSWGPNRLDAFWRMADGRLRHRWFDGAWRSAPVPTRCAVAPSRPPSATAAASRIRCTASASCC
jgi:hypothetical protein